MPFTLTLLKTAYTPKQLLSSNEGKIVFAGRSNVGKSSLLNALCNRKIAKTSSTPGKTQSINYYQVNELPLYLIDLPGYGYAQANMQKKQVWGNLMQAFFDSAVNLLTICVLLDARLPPQEKDIAMTVYAKDKGFSLMGILTKADKCTNSKLIEHTRNWQSILAEAPLVTSTKTKKGIQDLRCRILDFANTSLSSSNADVGNDI